MAAGRWRKAGRIAAAVAALPVALVAGVGALLGLIPANAGWEPPSKGIVIFVHSNGVHTSLVLPTTNAVMDWRPLVPAADLKVPAGTDHVMFGFGDRAFFLETPSWAELDVGTAVNAMTGRGGSVIHVDHVQSPQPGEDQRKLTLTPDQYARLAAFVRSHFRFDAAGRTVPVPGQGYGDNDAFYEADRSFTALYNCNEWTGRALRVAGVRMGLWTPLTVSVMVRLPR